MIIREPSWKTLIVKTNGPIFTPEQCEDIIKIGRTEPQRNAKIDAMTGGALDRNLRTSQISWIPFNKMPEMYGVIELLMHTTNRNHFGFDNMQLTEEAQYTEYPAGGFYDWHADSEINCKNEPPVRKISMTCLLSHESEFEGGGLELIEDGKVVNPKQGEAVFFASFIRHRVAQITKGVRKSLVMWFGGTPFK